MTSEAPRFPIGLTLATAVAFAILIGLGVWQLQRADWKAQELKRIAALTGAAPQPLAPVLTRSAGGADVSFTRVVVDCAPGSAPAPYRMTSDNGEWIARARAACRIPAGGLYDGVLVDRGLLTSSRGATTTPTVSLPAPSQVTGVLFARSGGLPLSLNYPAPYVLVAERETPAPPGVVPTPYPDPVENLHYVGAYAPTWFGLAGALFCIYAAMLWRRSHPKS